MTLLIGIAAAVALAAVCVVAKALWDGSRALLRLCEALGAVPGYDTSTVALDDVLGAAEGPFSEAELVLESEFV